MYVESDLSHVCMRGGEDASGFLGGWWSNKLHGALQLGGAHDGASRPRRVGRARAVPSALLVPLNTSTAPTSTQKKIIFMAATNTDDIGLLHALLCRDTSKADVKRLLHRHHELLLRTLERAASAEQPNNTTLKPPAFPAPAAGAAATAATTLLDVDERAAASLLSQLKRTAYNDAQALSDKEQHSSSPASGKAPRN